MLSLLTLVLAFGTCAALTLLFLRWVAGRRIVATENARSMHKGAVPTGGGLPLLAAALGTAVLLWPMSELHGLIAAALAVLMAVSWIDDVRTVPRSLRFAVHTAAAALLVLALPSDALVFQGALPLVADRLLAGLALVYFINIYNFMDGIDGLAGMETVAIAAGYVAVAFAAEGRLGPYHGLAMATAGATMGFLVWNWAPARIFLGDVGSVPLGFLMGVLMVDLAVRHALAPALILPLYFLADATLTLLRRVARGERPWEAHRDHAYQRAARALGDHAPVAVRVAVCNGVLVIAAVLALTAPLQALAIAVLAVAVLLLSLERAAAKSAVDRVA